MLVNGSSCWLWLSVYIAVFTIAFFSACELASVGDEQSGDGVGTLELRLHDSPVAYDEVHIFIERILIRKDPVGSEKENSANEESEQEEEESNGENDENGVNGESSENGENSENRDHEKDAGQEETESEDSWIVLSEPEKSINILDLVNGRFEVLGIKDLETGTYSQIRLILGEENTVHVNGEIRPLKASGGQHSGVKLNIDLNVNSGDYIIMQIDFDAAESILAAGPPGAAVQYLLKPVLRASLLTETGNISGGVLPVESRAVIYAVDESGQKKITTTFADSETGEFKLVGLPEGYYTLIIAPREERFESKAAEGIEVTKEVTTNVGEIGLSVAE